MRPLLRRIRYLLNRRRFEADLAEEMAVHREMSGAAAFGSTALAADQARDVWFPAALRDLSQDLRFAARLFLKDRWMTAVAVVTLAFSVGFDTTLFAIVSGMGGVPPLAHADRIVALSSVDRAGRSVGVSYLDFRDWRDAARSFDALAAYSAAQMTVTDAALPPERLAGAYVSASTFTIVGERPILGRDFRSDDDRPGAARVAIINGAVWKGRYGETSDVIGRRITVDGQPATIVGVTRDGFRFPLIHDIWLPLADAPALASERRDVRRLAVIGRLRSSIGIAQARDELTAIGASLSTSYPATNGNVRATVKPFTNDFDLQDPWTAMLLAVGVVLLIACANLANLLIARSESRAHELSIRASLGAGPWRIMRQLLVESVLLGAAGGVAAIGVARAGVRLWVASMPVANWPYWYHFAVDGRVIAYLCEVTAATIVLFGVGPAWRTARATGRRSPPRWTAALLGAQFALTLALLAGAGLLARTLLEVYRADSVVDTSHVVLAGLTLPPQKYATAERRLVLYDDLVSRVQARPEVEATALASGAPFYPVPVWSFALQGRASPDGDRALKTSYVLIGSRYFDVLHLRLLRGRPFTDLDGTPGHASAIASQLFASTFLPGADPIGQRIRLLDPAHPDPAAPWLTIVGVSPTVRQRYAQEIDPVVYVPYRQNPVASVVLMTRARADMAAIGPVVRDEIRQADPDLPVPETRPLDWLLSGTRFANRVFATLFAIAAALGLLLAAIGLHATVALAIGQRTREIGVRMAIGAPSSAIVWLFARRVLAPMPWAVAFGLIGAFGVGRFIRGMLIQTSPTDPLVLVSIVGVLVLTVVAAAVHPARRASRIDPGVALRHE